MRRGHPGIRGWRNSNPRHFRPHNGGIPPFRPARNFPLLDMPRFLQSGPRPLRGPHPYSTHPGSTEVRLSHEYHDRNKYRHISQHRPPERKSEHVQKHNYPPVQNMRHVDHSNMYKDTSKYYENQNSEQYHVNSMGDIDHRHLFNISHNRESYSQDQTSSRKIHIDEDRRKNFDERNQQNVSYKHIDNGEVSKVPVTGYIGHRPPSSDHYGNNLGTPNDDSNAFSCSIDDTVNIVRKRILHRNDPSPIDEPSAEKNHVEQTDLRENVTNVYQNEHQEQPKRRIQKQRQNVNCNKIKNKIVHQLFKMDKDKMCKLMDNPSSSTKFEYAISSLITESQNSYNRHMRSVAEKSLCCSNTEIIHSDNDKIYEDTFMKQMQCILDPQDTVLLEDIKPMVLAELSKVLHLDAFDQRFEMPEEQTSYLNTFCMQENNQNYDQYSNELYNFENYSHYGNENENSAYTEQCDQSRSIHDNNTNSEFVDQMSKNFEYHRNADSKLFERRPTRKSFDNSQDTKAITENQRRLSRKSVDNRLNEDSYESSKPLPQRSATPGPPRCRTPLPSISGTQLPLFDANTEQFYEDEDPFAELDKQYHVAVDHNFIETDEPQQTNFRSTPVNRELVSDINSPENNLYEDIEKEIDSQLETIAKSPIKLYSSKIQTEPPVLHVEFSTLSDQSSIERTPKTETIKEDVSVSTNNNNNTENNVLDNSNMNEEHLNTEAKDVQLKESENSITLEKSPIPTISRKRSVDQRPSHRKEKRKKSETESKESEPNKQMLNKNIIININDCVGKTPEKCDASKSMFNLYFSKNENKQVSKDNKTISSINDKAYSDKYVKRKEPSKKSKVKETENKNKRSFSTPSHSMLSPKESNITSSFNQTPKETKIKLKTIDMFLDQPRKVNIHQSYRNTSSSATITKNTQENKTNPTVTNSDNTSVMARGVKKFQSKLTQTSISKCSTSRFCQTETKKLVVKTVQTDPVVFSKSSSKSTDAFERMKEIDCEIQVLLQEKFKLYNSLESKHSYQKSTMQTFGMTVLNVNEVEETKENDTADSLSGDAIIEDFTNIPVEELEQIAFETVQDESISHETPKVKKRTQRLRVLKRQRKSSENSITAVKRSNRKSKTPNISLIEQIITDDRPLEDIISLEDLEVPPVKTKTKKKAQKPQQKVKKNLKMNPGKPIDLSKFKIRDCSVFVIREDLSKYLEKKTPKPVIQEDTNKEESVEQSNIVEETVLNDNDIQFDMLDVSEDIIIGEDHEVKLTDDKDEMERIDVSISEEIILDNSQSSMEDVMISDMEQVNNECRTYDYSSDESMRRDSITVTGNADAVLAIECIENKFLAACLDGNVYYFNADGLLLNTLRGSNLAVTCLTIVKENHGTTVYTGSLDSRIRYYDLESGLERGPECNVLSPIQTMDRAWDTVFVGTRTGFVLQFECKNNMLIPVSTVKFSEQSILALRAMKEGPRKVLLVAARSENVTIRDAQTGLLLRSLVGPKMTVYTLLYEDAKVYCGTSSHQIHMFDYTSGSHVGTHEGGKGAVCLRVAGGLLFAGCYDGCVYVYRDGECTPFAQLRGPSLMLLSLAILDTKIIAGYKDRSLYIWKIPNNVMQEMIL